MSRESYEQSKTYTDDLPRGAGDPDFYGYPGEPVDVRLVKRTLIQDIKPLTIEEVNQDVPF